MAQPWCTGPAGVWLGVGSNKQPVFLGHTETRPIIQDDVKLEQIMSDLTGSMQPLDFSWMGCVGTLGFTMTRYNETVYQVAINMPSPFIGVPGAWISGSMGSIVGLEGMAIPIWVQFPYSAKAAMATSEAGRHYFQCYLFGSQEVQAGTRVKKIGLTYIAWPITIATGVGAYYDKVMTGLPAVN